MNALTNQVLYVCGCCKQALPAEAFYVDRKTQRPNNYCKECRKNFSRKQREADKCMPFLKENHVYPVITQTKDPVIRMSLLRHALQVVAESIARKNKKRWEEEDCDL